MFACFISEAGVITIDGTNQGEPIYIQNPYLSSSNSFCISEVYVNDQKFTEIKSSAFEIPLSRFRIGQYVNIKIIHKDECKPKVLNPESLRSRSTFVNVSFKADEKRLRWTTKNETNEEPLIIEKFRNSKWVEIGKVIGEGTGGYNNYEFDVNHNSGLNRYRIKQKDLGDKHRFSRLLEYNSNKEPITFYPKRVSTEIYLTEKTNYEIFNSFGSLEKKGEDSRIDVSDFEPGVYYLNIDNRTEKFLKK